MSTNYQHNSKPPDQDYKNSSQEIDGFTMIAGFGRKIFSDKLVLYNFVIFFSSIFYSNYIEVVNCLATLGFLLAMKNWSLLKKYWNLFKKNIYDEFIKLAWGVQIQSAKSTLFAILFMLIASLVLSILINSFESLSKNFSFSEKQTIYFIDSDQEIKIKKLSENQKIEQEILKNKIGEKIDDHLSGLGDIMIGIGSALMALSVFVYESIARKRNYFNKYFLTGLTNNIILTILYFIGLLGLLLVYVMENYNWVKKFLEPALFCYVFLLIIFAGMRFIRIAIGLLFRDEEIKIEKEIVESNFEVLQRKKNHPFRSIFFFA